MIEVDDGGAPVLARVLGVSGPRLLIELPDDVTRQIRRAEVTRTVGPCADLASGLAEVERCVAIAARVLPRLWERALARGGEPLTVEALLGELPELAGEACAAYAVYAAVRDDSLYFRPAGALWRPRAREDVAETVERRGRHRRDAESRAALARVLREAWVGAREPAALRREVDGLDGAAPLLGALLDRAAHGHGGRERTEAAEVLRLVEQLEGLAPGALDGAEERLLRAVGVLGEHALLAMHREGIRAAFPAEVLEATDALLASGVSGGLAALPVVVDLRDRVAFTIDSEETDDRDDAFTVHRTGEGVEVGVHITTPAAWLDPAHPVVEEACRRGTTLYLPDRVLPMIPSRLGRALLYLDAGADRRTLTLLTAVAADGSVGASRLVLADVRVRHNLTWSEAGALLRSEAGPAEAGLAEAARGEGVGSALGLLHEAARRMAARREHWGATRVELPELRWRARGRPGDAVTLTRYDPSDVARLLVSEWMIHFNTEVGAWASREGVPVVYRWQKAPRVGERAAVLPDGDPLWRALQQVRGMRRAEIGLEPLRHAGLGIETYAPTTSPLRRAPDLLGHLNLWAALQGRAPVLEAPALASRIDGVRAALDSAASVTREADRYWGLRWLGQRVGEDLEVLVTAVEAGGRGRAQAVLVESLQRVWLAPRFASRVGERLWVRLERVETETGEIVVRPH